MPRAIQRPSVRRSDSRPIKRVIYTRRGSCRRESRWRALRRAKNPAISPRRARRSRDRRRRGGYRRAPGRLISLRRLPKIAQTEARKFSPLSRRRAFWRTQPAWNARRKGQPGKEKQGIRTEKLGDTVILERKEATIQFLRWTPSVLLPVWQCGC